MKDPHPVGPRDLVGLGVVLRHHDGQVDRELVAAGRVAVALARLAVLAVDLGDARDGREDHQVGEAALGRPLHRLVAALGRAPHRRVRLLEGPRPRVHVGIAVEAAVKGEGAFFRPRAEDQLGRLVEALARVGGIDGGGEVLGGDAAHETRDHAPAGGDVQHGDLLGEAQRVLAQGQAVAEDGDLGAAGAAHEHGRHDVGARHGAVAVLVVLVHADAVPAEPLRVLQLVEVLVVEGVADGGIVVAVGEGHPRRRLVVLHRVRHEVEVVKLH